MNLAAVLKRVAGERPGDTALVFRDRRVTYAELLDRVERCAAGFERMGVRRGDRVVLMMRNCTEFVVASYALARLGAISVPVNFLLKPSELRYIMNHCGASCAVAHSKFMPVVAEAADGLAEFRTAICCGDADATGVESFDDLLACAPLQSVREVGPDDVACILYTSGTTGRPKGAMLTHANLLANVDSCARAIEITRSDVFMCLLPMFHTFAWTTCVLLPLSLGCPIVVVESIQPFKEVARLMMKHHVTILIAVPPVFAAMTRVPFWRPLRFMLPLRLCVSGAAPLPRGVLEKFEAKFGRPLLEGYGLTEASPVVSLNPLHGERRAGTVGLALPGVEVMIVLPDGDEARHGDVGEICIRGRNVTLGYYNDSDATREAVDVDGWLRTGDLGRMQSGGYIEIVDRAKDLIIVKGFNVYSREVEDVLLMHPNLAEAAVIGIPDDTGDELVKAFVVPKEGKRVDKSELYGLCREHLAPYKMPREIVVTSILPKNTIGKILKRELRDESAAVKAAL